MRESCTKMFTAAEVADILQVHLVTVRRMIASNKIHAVHIGRTVRIPAAELDRLMNEGITQ